ncbi:phage tail tape measure protein [Bacillus cytotoxicus]|nr:phage tail tape measure protein [Bacillus cytotoxicus]
MAQDMELGVRVSMDLRNFDSGVAGMNRKLKMVDSEFKAASQEAKRYGDSVSQLRTKLDYLGQKLDIQKQKVGRYRQEIEKLRNKQQQLRTSSENLAGKMQRLEREYQQSAQATGRNSEQTKRLKQELEQVRSQYTMSLQSLSRVNAAIDKNTTSLNRAREGEARLRNEIRQTNETLERQTSLLHRTTERMRSVGTKMQDVGATMGASFMAGATTMGYALGKTITTAADFESAMSRVAALSGASDAELQKLTKTARDLGASTSFSASQAAEGMQYLAMAGFKTNDVIAAMPGLLDLAASGQMDLGAAADITSNIMSGFGIAAQDAGRVADVLAKASTNANTDVAQLGEAMVYLAPVSKSLGWSLEEATAAVMAMSDAGIQGAQAGAAFSTSMGRLAKPTGEMEKTMKKLKIEIFDANGKMKSMPGVIKELEKATRGMTDQQKSATLTTIFGAEAYKHWAVLIDKSSDALADNTEMLKNSAGTAKEIAAKQLDNLKGKIVILQSSIEGAAITIGHALIPAIDAIASGVQGVVDWFNNLDEGTQQVIATGAALTVGLMGVVGVLGLMTAAVGTLLANPVVLAIAAATGAVAGLGVALVKLKNDTEKANADALKFGDGVSQGTKKAAKGYVDLREQAMVNLAKLRVTSGEEAEKIVNETVEIFSKMGSEIKNALDKDRVNIQKATADLLGQIPEALKPTVEQIGNAAVQSIDLQMKKIQESEAIVLEGLRKFGGNISNMPKEFANQYVQAMGDMDVSSKVFVQKMSDMKNYMQTMQEQSGKINADGAKKWSKEINDAYSTAEKSAKKWMKTKEEEWEHQRASGHITKEQYDTLNKITKQAYDERIQMAKTQKKDALNVLLDSLSEEGQMYDLHEGKLINKKLRFLESEESIRKESMQKNREYVEAITADAEKSEKAMMENQEKLIKTYGQTASKSIEEFTNVIKEGGEKGRIAAQTLGIETSEGFKIDVGDKGVRTVESFVKGLQSGELTTRDAAVAHMNQLRTIYGTGSFSPEGLKAIESFAEGLKSEKPEQVAKQLGLDLKSDMEIDLGPNGKVTAQSFAEGLSNGTYTFDSIYQYFRQNLKNGMKFDLSDEGKKNIETLQNGMKAKAIDVEEAAKLLGLNVESGVQVDLGKAGEYNVQSLLAGLQTGDIKIQTFVEGVKHLLENGSKIDLTQQANETTNSFANGLSQNQPSVQNAAQGLGNTATEGMNTVDGNTPGAKGGEEFYSSLLSKYGFAQAAGISLSSGATEGMNTVDGSTPGAKGGDQFYTSLASRYGFAQGAGQSLGSGATQGMNTVDGNSPGAKGGDQFYTSLGARRGQAQGAGQSLGGGATQGMNTVNGNAPGIKGGTEFAHGIMSQSGNSQNSGKKVAKSGEAGLSSVKTTSVGASFASGFASGIRNGDGPVMSAAKGLANIALSAMKGELKINSPSKRVRDEAGHSVGEGFEVGIDEKIDTVQRAAQRMAKAAVPKVNPSDLSRATKYLNMSTYGFMGTSGNFINPNRIEYENVIGNQGNIQIEVPVVLEGREVARGSYRYITQYQERERKRNAAF